MAQHMRIIAITSAFYATRWLLLLISSCFSLQFLANVLCGITMPSDQVLQLFAAYPKQFCPVPDFAIIAQDDSAAILHSPAGVIIRYFKTMFIRGFIFAFAQ